MPIFRPVVKCRKIKRTLRFRVHEKLTNEKNSQKRHKGRKRKMPKRPESWTLLAFGGGQSGACLGIFLGVLAGGFGIERTGNWN